jgi:Ca2+-binding RTX toxin-like protein
LADGAHSLTAKITDKAGVTSPASAAVDVKIDTHAPDAPKIASLSTDGKAISGGAVNADHVTLTGTAEANSVVKVFDGTKQVGTATASDKGAWTYAADNLADGKHSFTSTASDAAGNVSKASAALGVNVDAHTSHGADSAFSDVFQKWNDTVTFKGTADPYSQITIYDNGKGSVGTVKAGSDGAWSLTTKSAVSDAVHNFTTKVMDSSGQSSAGAGSAILGTNGADTLKGTSGNDVLHGNGGRDTFVFAPNFGKDVINDFQEAGRSHDVLQFSKTVFDSFADVLSHASQSGHDVVINAGAGNTVTLKDAKLASLDKYDFHFA